MTALAVSAGIFGGLAVILGMWRAGMLKERSGVAILLVAIAFFYPLFAVMDGEGIVLHSVIFIAFLALAALGFRKGLGVLALGIVAHGVFDLITVFAGHPGPVWWPAFCGSLDIAAGLTLLAIIKMQRIPV